MICEKCGAEIEIGKIYCPECGYEATLVPEYNVAEDADFLKYMKDYEDNGTEGKNNAKALAYKIDKPWYAVVAVFACIIAFVGCIYLIYYSFTQNWFPIFVEKEPYTEAVELIANKSNEAAYDKFEELYAEDNDVNYLFYQYRCAKDLGDIAGQKRILETIVQNDPDNEYAVTGLVDVYLEDKDYDSFYRLYAEKPQFENLFGKYALPEPVFETKKTKFKVGDSLSIKSVEGVNIYYTIDGTDPKDSGRMYVAPIALTKGTFIVKARILDYKGMYSPISELEIKVK